MHVPELNLVELLSERLLKPRLDNWSSVDQLHLRSRLAELPVVHARRGLIRTDFFGAVVANGRVGHVHFCAFPNSGLLHLFGPENASLFLFERVAILLVTLLGGGLTFLQLLREIFHLLL
jgi:hypothetical protein